MDHVWVQEGTSASGVAAALRRTIWRPVGADKDSRRWLFPPQALNLVLIVDAGLRDEIEHTLHRAGRLQPSRLIICAVQPELDGVSARGGIGVEDARGVPGRIALAYERVEITVGPEHLSTLDTIVDLLLEPALPTLVWSPQGHSDGVEALRRLAQIVLVDSQHGSDAIAALSRATALADELRVVDLAWLRSTPWRVRVAALFDPADMRPELDAIAAVTVRHREDSLAAALLFAGWLCSRLRWQPSTLTSERGALRGRAGIDERDVEIGLEAVATEAPGLDGLTIELASGAAVAFDRAPGGLRTTRRGAEGAERIGALFGASAGEPSILADAIRTAVLRDPAYRSALQCARMMV
jgi:glucose-6-phosphate dehydrogenase assembly protein OpcA